MATEDTGPSGFSLFFSAIFALVVGVVCGVINLGLKPATVVTELPEPEEQDPQANYIILGESSAGGSYRPKERLMANDTPGTYRFSERELNAWASSNLTSRPQAPAEGEAEPVVSIVFEVPNFRMVAGQIQIVIPFTVGEGEEAFRGHYETAGIVRMGPAGVQYVAQETHLGTAPIPPWATLPFELALLAEYAERELFSEIVEAWDGVNSVSVENGELVVRVESP